MNFFIRTMGVIHPLGHNGLKGGCIYHLANHRPIFSDAAIVVGPAIVPGGIMVPNSSNRPSTKILHPLLLRD